MFTVSETVSLTVEEFDCAFNDSDKFWLRPNNDSSLDQYYSNSNHPDGVQVTSDDRLIFRVKSSSGGAPGFKICASPVPTQAPRPDMADADDESPAPTSAP